MERARLSSDGSETRTEEDSSGSESSGSDKDDQVSAYYLGLKRERIGGHADGGMGSSEHEVPPDSQLWLVLPVYSPFLRLIQGVSIDLSYT